MTNMYDQMLKRCLESDKIRKIYDEYIIKDITFKEWVIGNVDDVCFKYSLIMILNHKEEV